MKHKSLEDLEVERIERMEDALTSHPEFPAESVVWFWQNAFPVCVTKRDFIKVFQVVGFWKSVWLAIRKFFQIDRFYIAMEARRDLRALPTHASTREQLISAKWLELNELADSAEKVLEAAEAAKAQFLVRFPDECTPPKEDEPQQDAYASFK